MCEASIADADDEADDSTPPLLGEGLCMPPRLIVPLYAPVRSASRSTRQLARAVDPRASCRHEGFAARRLRDTLGPIVRRVVSKYDNEYPMAVQRSEAARLCEVLAFGPCGDVPGAKECPTELVQSVCMATPMLRAARAQRRAAVAVAASAATTAVATLCDAR